ncbi:MAG: sulfatase-like hydrolase/transferase [Planctomycetota bacterium]
MKVHQPNFPAPEFKGKSPGQYPYLDSLMELDFNSGSVIEAVRKYIPDDTMIVWTTDNGAWIDAWPDAGYTPFRGEKGSCYEGGFRCPAIAWWPGKIKAGTVATEMMSHMDWWPTFSALADVPEDQRPKRFWKDNAGKPIIFDGIDQSAYLLNPHEYSGYDQYTGFDPKQPKILGNKGPEGMQPLKPALRQSWVYFADNMFGAVRHKQYKFVFTTKDNWLGPSSQLQSPAVFKLDWDPGEQYDILFNGAAPTVGTMKSSPGRFAGPDHGWAVHYAGVVMDTFWDEVNREVPEGSGQYPYKLPPPAKGGASVFGIIPPANAPQ